MAFLQEFRGFTRNARLLLTTAFFVGLSMAVGGLFLNFYLQSLGLSQQFIGLANALPSFVLVAVGLPAGRLIDRHGPRWGLLVGTASASVAALGFALTGVPAVLLSFAVIQGVGAAFGFISTAPFQMANSTERERVALFSAQAALITGTAFLGNLVGSRLPAVFGGWLGMPADTLLPLRLTMLVVAALWALAALPIALTGPSAPGLPGALPAGPHQDGTVKAPRRRLLSNPGTVGRLLLPAFLISLGAGQTMPFLNIYVSGKFGVDFRSLGVFFAIGAFGTTLATLAQPRLAARVGKVESVLIVQAASIPFLLILGFVPVFWLVAVSFVVRTALMNMGNPVYQAFAQEQIPPGERATYSSLSTIAWSLGWAIGSAFSGWWRGLVGFEAGFNTMFGLMTVLYVTAIALMYAFFVRGAGQPKGG
jgi:MFS family permease